MKNESLTDAEWGIPSRYHMSNKRAPSQGTVQCERRRQGATPNPYSPLRHQNNSKRPCVVDIVAKKCRGYAVAHILWKVSVKSLQQQKVRLRVEDASPLRKSLDS